MNNPLPLDVMDRLNTDFGDRADAVAALLLAGRQIGSADCIGDRLVRCIVCAARGDESKVQHLIELTRQDYRDVIIAGEYDEAMRQIRDLSVSFLIDSPEKFWVGEVACMMASRGYRLAALETRPATAGPFAYTSDYGEGRATFIGPKGEIGIEKSDRQWLIHGNRRDLEIHELDHAFNDERAFRDAVSGYLLSKISARTVNEPNEVRTAQGVGRSRWRFWK
jgi:hypothetical protein